MSVSLTKGGNISLTKVAAIVGTTLGSAAVACGWDINETGGSSFDLDLVAAGLDKDGKLFNREWFIYYSNKRSPQDIIRHSGDNLTGAGEGDDETIVFDFPRIPSDIKRIVIAVNIYRADSKGQAFGDVQNAFVRVYDSRSQMELVRYDMGHEFTTETLVVFGELYRHGDDWKFRAIGQGYSQIKFHDDYGTPVSF